MDQKQQENRNFVIIGILIIIILALLVRILVILETNTNEDLNESGTFMLIPFSFLKPTLILFLAVSFRWGPFENRIKPVREDGGIVLLLIAMFILGFLIEPSLDLPYFGINNDILGLFILLLPFAIIIFMIYNFQQGSKGIPTNIIEEE